MNQMDYASAGAMAALQRKQARRARWSAVGGVVIGLLLLLKLVFLILPDNAPACDDGDLRTTITDLLNSQLKKNAAAVTVTDLSGFRTVSGDSKLNRCTAHVTFSDKSNGTLDYRVDPKEVTLGNIQ